MEEEPRTMLIRPLRSLAFWAMNNDLDLSQTVWHAGFQPTDFLAENLWVTPSSIRKIWDTIAELAEAQQLDRPGLRAGAALPFDRFRQPDSSREFYGVEMILYSNNIRDALKRFASFYPSVHRKATVSIRTHGDATTITSHLGPGDPGPHHRDFCAAFLISTLTEALGRQLPLLKVGAGFAKTSGFADRLFADAECVVVDDNPYISINSETLDWKLCDEYPDLGPEIDAQLSD